MAVYPGTDQCKAICSDIASIAKTTKENIALLERECDLREFLSQMYPNDGHANTVCEMLDKDSTELKDHCKKQIAELQRLTTALML